MTVSGIESIGAAGFTPYVPPTVSTPATGGASSATGTASAGTDFGNLVTQGIDKLDNVQRTSDDLAVKAASGNLANIHDYTIAATQASVTTQVTVAVRNKAVEAFTEIMRMQV